MNKAIKEDFDYRKELKSWFELSIEKIWELIDRDSGNQNFWSIYSKENILDPYNDFDNETKEKAKKSNSKWFCLNSGFSEIGSDYDLQCYYDDYRSSNKYWWRVWRYNDLSRLGLSLGEHHLWLVPWWMVKGLCTMIYVLILIYLLFKPWKRSTTLFVFIFIGLCIGMFVLQFVLDTRF